MIQCFIKKKYTNSKVSLTTPELVSISNRDKDFSELPRIMHNHSDIVEIILVRKGSGVYILDNKRYPIKKGDIIICNSNVLHDEMPEYNDNLSIYCCSITNIKIPGLPDNCLIDNTAKAIFGANHHFENINNLMYMIFNFLSNNVPGCEETCHHLMMSLLSMVLNIQSNQESNQYYDKTNQYMLYLQIRDYIDIHYDDEITLTSLSSALNLSAYYICHVFKNITGYSPMQYMLRRRIGEAQTLLINSKYSITKVASLVGYGNPNYFNIIFTKKIGVSPSQYRKTYTTLKLKEELYEN